MGSCMSKSQGNFKLDQIQSPSVNTMNPERRRRLSVSQSADVVNDPGDERGSFHLNISEDSILNLFSGRRRFSLSGAPAQTYQCAFDDKSQRREGTDSNLSDLGIGYACKKGLKPESPNQDDFFILRVDDWGLYGVFDGHGPNGHDISNFGQTNFPKLLVKNTNFKTNPERALRETFIQLHKLIEEEGTERNKFDCRMSGTTATVALHLISEKKLFVAHVGDSRSVLASQKENGEIIAVDMTDDHKPELEAESKRITASGGVVRRLDYDIPWRVFVKGRSIPGLAMSRALGDCLAHSVGVIAVPDVTVREIDTSKDMFLLICSDGVWEFISSKESVDIINEKINISLEKACETLAAESWHRWLAVENNVVDDITVLLINLKVPQSPRNVRKE